MRKSGQPWTREEEQDMLRLLKEGNSFESIATIHGRTTNAIQLRFGQFCKRDGRSLSVLSTEYHVNPEKIREYIDKLEPPQLTKSTSYSDVVLASLREEIATMQTRLHRLSKTLKIFITTTEDNHNELKEILTKKKKEK